MKLDEIAAAIARSPKRGTRRLVALSGAPASGKSTVAQALAARDTTISVVPMDGFHLDNPLLKRRGLLDRKGAPETFDVEGLVHLVRRFAAGEAPFYPLFDRGLDRSIAGAGEIGATCETVLFEGNYLLLDSPTWHEMSALWDFRIAVHVPRDVLRARLLERWRAYGFSDNDALAKAQGNDLPNADLVMGHSLPADLLVETVEGLQ